MRTLWLAVLAGFVLACTHSTTPAQSPAQATSTESATPTIITADGEVGTASQIFNRALDAMKKDDYASARRLFDIVARAESATTPATPFFVSASFDAALCSENLGEIRDARDRYRALSKRGDVASRKDGLDSELRWARLASDLEDYTDLAESSKILLARSDLNAGDHAEVLALSALTMIQNGDFSHADSTLASALDVVSPPDGSVPAEVSPQNRGAVFFARGDAIGARASAIKFVPVPNDFGQKLEERCDKLLKAEDQYIEAIRTKDIRWTVRAGVRVASQYTSLHDDLIAIPAPITAKNQDDIDLFRGAMRLRYRILVTKGLDTLSRVVRNFEAAASQTMWFDHAKKAMMTLQNQLAEEKAELAKLPYTEKQLQQALDAMIKRNGGVPILYEEQKPTPPKPVKIK
jgi:tetratricopeptide (TPR) repeat protein